MNYSICVSGAAIGKTVEESQKLAEEMGALIAKAGHTIVTGATVGLPYFAARAAVVEGGQSIGFSPAASIKEHVNKYRLPIGVFDFINFTGMHYVGRDVYLVQSSDAVITIGGRFGSLHEFTTALESRTPCGVLLGSGGTSDIIPELMERIEAINSDMIVFDDNPKRLLDKVLAILDEEYKHINTKALAACWYVDDDCDEYGRPKRHKYDHKG